MINWILVIKKEILEKYADLLVNFAINDGKGVQKGEMVCLQISESAKEMVNPLQSAVLKSGGNIILKYYPEGTSKTFFQNANNSQLQFFPKNYLLEKVKACDHTISIISTWDKYELKGVDSKKIMLRNKSSKFFIDAINEKENRGEYTWSLGLFGTEQMAKDVNMTLEEYWEQIIKACYLDYENPIQKWREVFAEIHELRKKLDDLKIQSLEITGEDVDLTVKIGEKRKWLGGTGHNIPSFEIFISPDWRGTNGWMKFNQPLYRYGNLIEGIELEFKDGIVVGSKASEGEKLLKDMISVENANKIGEFSLTDKKFSRITKFMGETLYDENVGGEYGNSHIALGSAYKESFTGKLSELSKKESNDLGFNDSVIHTDIVSTSDRTVTATLKNGKTIIIYQNGEFQI